MAEIASDFRIDLDSFKGPMDLLLYLVRKHELDILDIPVAVVLEQYLEFLDILESQREGQAKELPKVPRPSERK